MALGAYDLITLVVLLVGFLAGRHKGFAWQVSGLATLLLGYAAATLGSTTGAGLFPATWPPDLRRYAAWTTIYAGVTVAIYLATLKVAKKITDLKLEGLDKTFGGWLGAFKAGALLALVSLAAVAVSERAQELVRESHSGRALVHVASIARPLLPDRIGDAVGKVLSRIEAAGPPETTPPGPPEDASPAPGPVARPRPPVLPPAAARPAQPAAARPAPPRPPVPPTPRPAHPGLPDDPDADADEENELAPSRRTPAPRTPAPRAPLPESPGKTSGPEPDGDVPLAEPADPLAPPR